LKREMPAADDQNEMNNRSEQQTAQDMSANDFHSVSQKNATDSRLPEADCTEK